MRAVVVDAPEGVGEAAMGALTHNRRARFLLRTDTF